MTDVALSDAQLVWDRDGAAHPPLKVVGGGVKDDQRYSASWGSCNQDFDEADDEGRLRMLLTQSIFLTLTEGLPQAAVHEALMVIPEYRAEMVRGSVIPPENEAEY